MSPFRYPFGLHGYHRASGKTGKVSLKDPLNVFGSTFVPGEKEAKEAAAAAQAEEGRKTALRDRINTLYGITTDPEGVSAKQSLDAENTKLADATRSYYTDQLGKTYDTASRNTRFKLARQGLLGGSEDVFQQGEVSSDRDLGATRVDEAVRRAIASLTGQREQERLNAVGLVNSGQGDSAVSAAQAGLRGSFENTSNAAKENLFGDLFANGADAVTANNLDQQAALLGARYNDRLGSFFSRPRTATSGRVTPTG